MPGCRRSLRRDLVDAGDMNVVELEGGMNAWTRAGRVLGP